MDLLRTEEAVTAQWTFKENGAYQIWPPVAAALVEWTKNEIQFDRFRLIDHHLKVQYPE